MAKNEPPSSAPNLCKGDAVFDGGLDGTFHSTFEADFPWFEMGDGRILLGARFADAPVGFDEVFLCDLRIVTPDGHAMTFDDGQCVRKRGPVGITGKKKPDALHFLIEDSDVLSFRKVLGARMEVSRLRRMYGTSELSSLKVF